MLPIINILLIVGILLFILYNLYVDTRNWSNTGSFLEGMENSPSSAAPAAAPAVAAPSGFKFVSTGKPVEDISQEECKTFTDKLDGYSFSVINESGNPKGCMFQDGTPPGSKGVYYNTGGTADCGVFNGVSKCVVKDTVGAGSAETAMNDEVNSRAGNVAPMGTNVPQKCKKASLAPAGPK